jgi:hypothetical protein
MNEQEEIKNLVIRVGVLEKTVSSLCNLISSSSPLLSVHISGILQDAISELEAHGIHQKEVV